MNAVAGQQNGKKRDNAPGANQQGGGKHNKNKNRQQPVIKAEVSDEDVAKQVKETLARLTNKNKAGKGAKYRKEKRENARASMEEQLEEQAAESKVLKLTEFVTANELAVMMDVPVTQVISTCMSIGIMVSINQRLDAETINLVAEEFGFKTEYVSAEVSEAVNEEEDDEEEELSEEEQLEHFIEDMQPEIDPNTIISRKRQLTDEEKQLFTYFVAVPGMKEQLVDVLCDVQKGAADKTSQTGNVIVMGGRETGKTRLISSLIPAICRELNIEASKVAYIFAEDLNGKNIAEIASKLAGGFLVIENANQLSQETADELDEVMNGNTKSMIVILEDEKIGMRKLIARYPKLAKKFTSMINIPVFTNDELVNFAKVYTMENGFRIDQMGMLALYNLIGINQKEDQPMCIGTVKTMLDNAMAKAQGGLFKRSKKRVDRDGFTVLLEKDFS